MNKSRQSNISKVLKSCLANSLKFATRLARSKCYTYKCELLLLLEAVRVNSTCYTITLKTVHWSIVTPKPPGTLKLRFHFLQVGEAQTCYFHIYVKPAYSLPQVALLNMHLLIGKRKFLRNLPCLKYRWMELTLHLVQFNFRGPTFKLIARHEAFLSMKHQC